VGSLSKSLLLILQFIPLLGVNSPQTHDDEKRGPLFWAVEVGCRACVRLLLTEGAAPVFRMEVRTTTMMMLLLLLLPGCSCCSCWSCSCCSCWLLLLLLLAASAAAAAAAAAAAPVDLSRVRLLPLTPGAFLQNGYTVAHWAIQKGELKIVEMLLDAKQSVWETQVYMRIPYKQLIP